MFFVRPATHSDVTSMSFATNATDIVALYYKRWSRHPDRRHWREGALSREAAREVISKSSKARNLPSRLSTSHCTTNNMLFLFSILAASIAQARHLARDATASQGLTTACVTSQPLYNGTSAAMSIPAPTNGSIIVASSMASIPADITTAAPTDIPTDSIAPPGAAASTQAAASSYSAGPSGTANMSSYPSSNVTASNSAGTVMAPGASIVALIAALTGVVWLGEGL